MAFKSTLPVKLYPLQKMIVKKFSYACHVKHVLNFTGTKTEPLRKAGIAGREEWFDKLTMLSLSKHS